MRRVLVGIPTHGEITALTAQSLWELAKNPVTGWDFELLPLALGPYVPQNVAALVELFGQRPGEDYLLRIDSDMTWNVEWVEHFCRRHERLEESGITGPILHGGVYGRRQRSQHHTPVVSPIDVEGASRMLETAYIAWAAICYRDGKTIRAGRVGGGWVLMNRGVAAEQERHGDLFLLTPGEGEDYGSCRRLKKRGGRVFATWPGPNSFFQGDGGPLEPWSPHRADRVGGPASCGASGFPVGPSLGHVISAHDVVFLSDYFRAVSHIRDVGTCVSTQDVKSLPHEVFEDVARG